MKFRRLRRWGRRDIIRDEPADRMLPDESGVNVTSLKNGQSAVVTGITGPEKPARRLAAMGIIPGAVITKRSASAMKGPVVIEKNGKQLAVGFHMARMILVEQTSIKTGRHGEQL